MGQPSMPVGCKRINQPNLAASVFLAGFQACCVFFHQRDSPREQYGERNLPLQNFRIKFLHVHKAADGLGIADVDLFSNACLVRGFHAALAEALASAFNATGVRYQPVSNMPALAGDVWEIG